LYHHRRNRSGSDADPVSFTASLQTELAIERVVVERRDDGSAFVWISIGS